MYDQVRIAICEDDKTQLDYICSLVETWAEKKGISYKVDGYVSSEQLLYSFDKDFPYFLYVLDIQMGEINNEIWYVMSKGHYVEMTYDDKKIEWKASIKSIQELFEKKGFVMTTRGLLVNLRRIARVGKKECVLDNGELVSISRNRYRIVNEAFISFYKGERK